MAIYVDDAIWPRHGRLWAHLVSDRSYAELQHFGDRLGVPRRAFDRDHYDIPAELVDEAIALGAIKVGPKELLRRLVDAGLRVR
jgi:hypothetical protein